MTMLKTREEVEVTPPRVEDLSDKDSSKNGTLKGSYVEELSSELIQFKLQRKIDKLKSKKSQQLTSSSSSNDESDASFAEEVNGKRRRKRDKRSYNNTFFNYDNLPSSSTFTSIPIGKARHFDGTDYTKWKYAMNMHLISMEWIIPSLEESSTMRC
jgi:hypothetical protein